MKRVKILMVLVLLLSLATLPSVAGPPDGGGSGGGGGGGHTEVAGNNLSYPVIWSEGMTKVVPGSAGMTPVYQGDYWYQWGTNGTDPDVVPASCPHDPDENNPALNPNGDPYCDDNVPGQLSMLAGTTPVDNPLPLVRAYLQKDPGNTWRAWDGIAPATIANSKGGVDVDWIDWGDNLESNDWYTRSKVRTEVVLFKDLVDPVLDYEMRHTSGWGIDEVHGMAVELSTALPVTGPGTSATVYSPCARQTIQKLLVPRDDARLADLIWVPEEGWTEPADYGTNLINEPIFNKAVHEATDGPGSYTAEINVKGRIIYGYTWNVRSLNDMTPPLGSKVPTAAGDYRITFSFDQSCGTASLATHFISGTTEIVVPIEEAVTAEEEPSHGGADAVLVPAVFDDSGALVGGNFTYMDVRILQRGGGGGGRYNFEGDCVCECEGDKCVCTCKEECDCTCNCEGAQCTCTCLDKCDCDCACQNGVCDCACQNACQPFQAHMQVMEQHREQLQTGCPGEGCPCRDEAGTNACQQYRAELTNMVTAMQQLQYRTCCDGESCGCVCQSGDGCLQLQTMLQTMLQTQDQLMNQCQTSSCEANTAFFDTLRSSLVGLSDLLEVMERSYQNYLPALQKSE